MSVVRFELGTQGLLGGDRGGTCKSRLASHSSWIWSESESLGQLENGKIRLVMNCKAELNEGAKWLKKSNPNSYGGYGRFQRLAHFQFSFFFSRVSTVHLTN